MIAVPPTTLGFIGLGAMGGPMVRRLATRGHRVLVHDLNPASLERAALAGSVPATLSEIAAHADLVMTCLPSLEALQAVVLGPRGLAGGQAVRTIVDFSTTGVDFARDTAKALRAHGIDYLDAPITGNVAKAGDGTLGVMCSGPRMAYERAEPVLRDLASTIVLYLGEQQGQAQKLKLLNNLLSATGMAVTCEAFILGAKWGLDPDILLGVINAGEASSSASRNKFPKSVLPRRFDFGARMAITAKDISLNVSEGEEAGVPMWIGDAVRQVWQYAAAHGGAEQDGSSLISFLEPWSGVTVRGTGQARLPSLPPPSATPTLGRYRLVVACDAAQRASLAERLRSGAGQAAGVPVLGLPVGCHPQAVFEAVQAAMPDEPARPRLLLNLIPMACADSQALESALRSQGDAAVDAAWSTASASGSARLLASGAPEAVAAAGVVLLALGEQVVHVSEQPGGAHLTQQIEGAVAATLLAATCEAYAVGATAGLAPETLRTIMGLETGRSAASERIVPEQVATRAFAHGRRLADAGRDLDLLLQEAHRLGVSCWVLEKATVLYRLAAAQRKPADDITQLATLYEVWAGVQIRALGAAH